MRASPSEPPPAAITFPPVPRVSVLMTVYNGARHLRAAIDSVLAQTLTGFELVIVDDGSTDGTQAVLAACRDPRIRVIRPDRNLGAAAARGLGLAACRGAYIAAHDHDDLSLPARLATQVRYLDAHPEIVLAGAEVMVSSGTGPPRATDHQPGCTPMLLRWMLHVDNPLTYSSVMFRADAVRRLEPFMRTATQPAEDFDFYHRLLRVGPLARLDETLTVYRWHDTNITQRQSERMFASAGAVLTRAYQPWLGADAAAAAALVVRHLSDRRAPHDRVTLARLGDFLERILAAFLDQYAPGAADRAMIEAHAGRIWWRTVRAATRFGSPLALMHYFAPRGLRRGFTPSGWDVAVSLAVGVTRAIGIARRRPPPG